MRFAAKHCDQLVVAGNTIEKVAQVDERLAPLLVERDRVGAVAATPFTITIVRENEGEAEEEYERLQKSLNVEAAIELAADILGGIESLKALYGDTGFEEAARAWGSGQGILKLLGTADQVTEQLIELKQRTSTSNVLINFPLWNPQEVRSFRVVLEQLRDAHLWSRPEERAFSW